MLFSNKKSVNIHLILKIKFLFSQLLEIIVIIFVLNIGLVDAMYAKIRTEIQGSLPYLLLDNIKVVHESGLHSLKVPDDASDTGYSIYVATEKEKAYYPNAIVNKSSQTKPIEVPVGTTFQDLKSFVPIANNANYPEMYDSDLKTSYAVDDDGDEISPSSRPRVVISVEWLGYGDIPLSRPLTKLVKETPNQELNPCVVYKLTMKKEGFNFDLTTLLGKPYSRKYANDKNTVYYIRAKSRNKDAYVCYIGADARSIRDNSFDGDQNWIKGLGVFKVQDGSNASMNLPSTGMLEYGFQLFVNNISVKDVITANGRNVLPVSGDSSVSLSLSSVVRSPFEETEALQIKFQGSRIRSSPFIPTIFTLYSDTNHTKVLYSFKIERLFFIIKDNFGRNFSSANKYCRESGFRLVNPSDLTNANYEEWNGGIPGNGNSTIMQLSYKNDEGNWVGGVLNEWTALSFQGASRLNAFWTAFVDKNRAHYYYDTSRSQFRKSIAMDNGIAMCVSP